MRSTLNASTLYITTEPISRETYTVRFSIASTYFEDYTFLPYILVLLDIVWWVFLRSIHISVIWLHTSHQIDTSNSLYYIWSEITQIKKKTEVWDYTITSRPQKNNDNNPSTVIPYGNHNIFLVNFVYSVLYVQ